MTWTYEVSFGFTSPTDEEMRTGCKRIEIFHHSENGLSEDVRGLLKDRGVFTYAPIGNRERGSIGALLPIPWGVKAEIEKWPGVERVEVTPFASPYPQNGKHLACG